jgi:hypothetical protein
MKRLFTLGLIALFFSCSKTEVKPSAAETNGVLLAGAKGSSKTWQISSATGSFNSGSIQTLSLDDCFIDNAFKFNNDDSQSFEHTEGLTKCDSSDPTLIEKGSWAFTADGKKLIFDAIPYSNQYLFYASAGTPAIVTDLTDTSFKCSFNIVQGADTYHFTFVFSKK